MYRTVEPHEKTFVYRAPKPPRRQAKVLSFSFLGIEFVSRQMDP